MKWRLKSAEAAVAAAAGFPAVTAIGGKNVAEEEEEEEEEEEKEEEEEREEEGSPDADIVSEIVFVMVRIDETQPFNERAQRSQGLETTQGGRRVSKREGRVPAFR